MFQARTGTLDTPAAQDAIEATVAAMEKLPDATGAVGPVGPLAAELTSKDGTIAFASVQYSVQPPSLGTAGFNALEAAAAPAVKAGLNVQYGGPLVDYANVSHTNPSDAIGLLVSVIILLFVFGTVVAAGIPIGTALLGLSVGLSGILLIAATTDVPTVAPDLGTMIGLGVGIDYSLFIVARHRENLRDGMETIPAVGHALATSGQAVVFAGTTVVIAICGLMLSGIPYVATLGFMAALVVAVMMLAALDPAAGAARARRPAHQLVEGPRPAPRAPQGHGGRRERAADLLGPLGDVGRAAPLAVRGRGDRGAPHARRRRSCRSATASPTTAPHRRRRRSTRPSSCSRRGSAPASTARSPSWSRTRRAMRSRPRCSPR